MLGFQNVSLSGTNYRFELYQGGKRRIRGAGGRFTSAESVGLSTVEIDAIFQQLSNQAAQMATAAVPPIQETVQIGHVTVAFQNLREVVYAINYIESVVKLLPSMTTKLQAAVQRYAVNLVAQFVEEVVRPKAMVIIDELVYSQSMQRLTNRILRQKTRYANFQERRNEMFDIDDPRFNRIRTTQDESGRTKFYTIGFFMRQQPGAGAVTWGERWAEQAQARISTRRMMAEYRTTGARHQEMFNFANVSLSNASFDDIGSALQYSGPTGRLRQALYQGVIARGTAIQIGIDESVFEGKVYWQFVEHGHRYVLPTKNGGRVELPYREPPKPFLTQLNNWMMTEGRQELSQFIQQGLQSITGKIGSTFNSILSARGVKVAPMVGEQVTAYFNRPASAWL